MKTIAPHTAVSVPQTHKECDRLIAGYDTIEREIIIETKALEEQIAAAREAADTTLQPMRDQRKRLLAVSPACRSAVT